VCLPCFLVCTLSERCGLLYKYEAVFSIEKYLFMPRQAVEYGPCFDGKSLRYPADDTASNCGPGVRPGHRRRSHRAASSPISSVPPPTPSLWSWDILGSPLPTPLAHHGKSCFSRMCSLSLRAAKPFFFCDGYRRFMAGRPSVRHYRSASGIVCCCARHLSGDLQRDCTFVRDGIVPPPRGCWNRWLLCWSLMDFAGAIGGTRVTCDPCAHLCSLRW